MSALPLTPWLWVNLLLTAVLILGATLRLSRLITSDTISDWYLRSPLSAWAIRSEQARRAAVREVIETTDPETLTPDAVYLLARLQSQLDDKDDWMSWQGRLVSGLYCPFCVGFWVGAGVLLFTVLVAPLAVWVTITWALITAILTLNYLAGHISARID